MPRMRSRTIHPEFFTDADLYEAEQAHGLPLRMAFAGLWCAADRERRFEWKPKELKLTILPFDDVDFGLVIEALRTAGFIAKYEVAGKSYGLVHNLLEWQHIHKDEAQSRLPAPPDPLPDNPPRSLEIHTSSQKSPGVARNPQKSSPTSTSTSTTPQSNGAHAPNGKHAGGWPARWSQVYGEHVGVMDPARIGKRCSPVVQKRGEARATEMWDSYCRHRRHFRFGKFDAELHNDVKATTPEDFAQTEQTWFDYTEPLGVRT